MEELRELRRLGIHSIHFYADLFTASRDQVVRLCHSMIDERLGLRWTCNSRVDFVDQELLRLMREAGCWMISWGIESGNDDILKRVGKGITKDKVLRALQWSQEAGVENWGYFIIGLPGETEGTIRETIDFAKQLPLYLVLFHIAAPHPGTPFFFEVVQEGWFRPGTVWEEVEYGPLDRVGLSQPQGRRAGRMGQARLSRVGTAAASLSGLYQNALGLAFPLAPCARSGIGKPRLASFRDETRACLRGIWWG